MDNQNFETTISLFCENLNARLLEYKNRMCLTYFDRYEVIRESGNKYIKILSREMKSDCTPFNNSKKIVAFIDKNTGDILKPASWKVPAKHARGNIFSDQFGMEAIDENGFVKYLK